MFVKNLTNIPHIPFQNYCINLIFKKFDSQNEITMRIGFEAITYCSML